MPSLFFTNLAVRNARFSCEKRASLLAVATGKGLSRLFGRPNQLPGSDTLVPLVAALGGGAIGASLKQDEHDDEEKRRVKRQRNLLLGVLLGGGAGIAANRGMNLLLSSAARKQARLHKQDMGQRIQALQSLSLQRRE